MSRRFGLGILAAVGVCVALTSARPASATTGGIDLVNRDFNLPGGGKVVPFDVDGAFVPGLIPGWIFEGPGTEVRFNGIDPGTMLPFIKGDSSTEPGGGFGLTAGNHLTLSTLDGKVYQTSAVNVSNIPATQAYRLTFEAFDAFTIDDADPPVQIPDRAQLTARLYYDSAGTRVEIIDQAIDLLPGTNKYTLQIAGGSPALGGAALGKPIGVEFDTTSIERNLGLPEFPVAHSWVAVDNVLFQITGVAPGDLNGDGSVNATDYGLVRDNQQLAQIYEAQGELTGDNFVNLDDFRAFKTIFAPGAGAGSGGLATAGVPEPSTLVLVFIVAAAAGSTLRRRFEVFGRLRACLLTALGVGATLVSALPSSAELKYYDGFEIGPGKYTLGIMDPTMAAGDGQNPTIGPTPFFSGAWQIRPSDGNAPNQNVQATGLAYLGAPAVGGSVGPLVDVAGTSADARVGRFLTNPWTDTTEGTFYIGYQASYGAVVDPLSNDQQTLGFRTTEFWPVGNIVGQDDNRSEIGFQGFAGDTNQRLARFAQLRFVTPDGGTQFLTDTVFNEFGGTHLIVMKFVLSATADMDAISVYLDPTSSTEPDLPSASASGLNFTLGAMSTISFFGTPTGTLPVFDELRVTEETGDGLAFTQVIPPLPLPGDTNGDGFVDIVDFNSIVAHLNLSGQTTFNGDVAGANGKQGTDGKVDLRDLQLWRTKRTDLPGAGAGSLGGSGVPEPSSLLMALTAAVAFARMARRAR